MASVLFRSLKYTSAGYIRYIPISSESFYFFIDFLFIKTTLKNEKHIKDE